MPNKPDEGRSQDIPGKSKGSLASDTDASSLVSTTAKKRPLEPLLQQLMQQVNRQLVLGSSNRVADVERTGGWSKSLEHHTFAYGSYVKLMPGQPKDKRLQWANMTVLSGKPDSEQDLPADTHPLPPPKAKAKVVRPRWVFTGLRLEGEAQELDFEADEDNPHYPVMAGLQDSIQDLLLSACVTEKQRYGNCQARAELFIKRLWEYSLQHPGCGIHSMEMIKMNDFDHVMVIINRHKKAETKLFTTVVEPPETFGADCFVVDCWHGKEGLVFKGTELGKVTPMIAEFARGETQQLKALGIEMADVPVKVSGAFSVLCAISPGRDNYPGTHVDTVGTWCNLDDFRFGQGMTVLPLDGFSRVRDYFHKTQNRKHKATMADVRKAGGLQFFTDREAARAKVSEPRKPDLDKDGEAKQDGLPSPSNG